MRKGGSGCSAITLKSLTDKHSHCLSPCSQSNRRNAFRDANDRIQASKYFPEIRHLLFFGRVPHPILAHGFVLVVDFCR